MSVKATKVADILILRGQSSLSSIDVIPSYFVTWAASEEHAINYCAIVRVYLYCSLDVNNDRMTITQ